MSVTLTEAWGRERPGLLAGPTGHRPRPRGSLYALGSCWGLRYGPRVGRGPGRASVCLSRQGPGADLVLVHRILITGISQLSLGPIINAQKIHFQQRRACNYMFLGPISPPEPDGNLARGFCLIYLSVPSPSQASPLRTPGTWVLQLGERGPMGDASLPEHGPAPRPGLGGALGLPEQTTCSGPALLPPRGEARRPGGSPGPPK